MKTRYEFARELHLTFASVGGGLHLAILAYKIYELFSDHNTTSSQTQVLLIILQLFATLVIWLRMYWVYLNTLVFFKPFDNPGIFAVDVMAFFFGALAIFFMGQGWPWFLAGGLCLAMCCVRIWYTLRHSGERRDEFPHSVDKLQQSHPRLLAWMVAPTLYALLAAIVLGGFAHSSSRVSTWACAFFLLICIPVFLYAFDPFYPLAEDRD